MAPDLREDCRADAAVLALVVNRPATNLLLIRRAERGDPWSGQIALPGGRLEASDADARAAAYRETAEEVGIARSSITPLGCLGLFQTQLRPVDVAVFVGLWTGQPVPRRCVEEVAEIIEYPLVAAWRAHRERRFRGHTPERIGDRLTYPCGDTEIWGVTARILHCLLEWLGDPLGDVPPGSPPSR